MSLPARIAASFNRSGVARDNVVGAAAVPVVLAGAEGTGALSSRRLHVGLLALLAMFVGLAFSAGPAFAAPPTVTTPVVSDVSYTTAQVASNVDPKGGFASYKFEVSTDGTNWTPNAGGFFSSKETLNAELTGLDDATKYFVRLTASNFGEPEVTSPGPNPEFTTLTAAPPTIPGAVGVSGVFSTSATAAGKVIRPSDSDDAVCRFEYVTDADFGSTGFDGAVVRDCEQNPIGAPDAGTEKDVTAKLGCTNPVLEDPEGKCLEANTTYHLRLVAETAGGSVTKDAGSTFTTLAPVAKPTVLAADDVADPSYFSANVSGEVQRPAGADPALDTSCRFEYVTDEQFTATGFDGAGQTPCAEAPAEAPLSGTGPTPVSAQLSGLDDDTTYHLRLTAENGGGTDSKEAASTFTTPVKKPPELTVDSASPGYTTAEVSGAVNPQDGYIFSFYEYSSSPSDPASWVPGYDLNTGAGFYLELGSGTDPVPFSGTLTGLKPGTTYAVRIFGTNFGDLNVHSPELTFTTEGTSTPPEAIFDPVVPPTGTTAHFTGTVDTHAPGGPLSAEGNDAYRTKWHFECTPACPSEETLAGVVEAEEGSKTISIDALRLDGNTHYQVKLVVENAVATVEAERSFDVPLIKPTVRTAPGGSDGKGGYTLQGIVNPNNSPVTTCEFKWGPNSSSYAFSAPCSPAPGAGPKAVTVEAHLTGLNPGVVYHYNLVATNGAGQAESGDQEFIPTLDPAPSCPNEQIRRENNSLALPECRAYEKITPEGKEGFDARFRSYSGGDRVSFISIAGNLAKSGQNRGSDNYYVASRAAAGWETIPNLNGASGTFKDAPSSVVTDAAVLAYSSDLLSSLWDIERIGDAGAAHLYLRNPDGTFTVIGPTPDAPLSPMRLTSADLSHVVVWPNPAGEFVLGTGEGVYEYVGTNDLEPSLVDVDNSGSPITACRVGLQTGTSRSFGKFLSKDGRVAVFTVIGGCGGANPPTNEIWARVGGTTSIDVSASQCDRTAADPGGLCNGPVGSGQCRQNSEVKGEEVGPGCRNVLFEGAAEDGSRIFFSTNQQLLNGDIDQTRDVYACDIPSGTPSPGPGKANHCSALRQISVAGTGAAEVENVLATSADGSTVLFTAKGLLASNQDALGEDAAAGGHNLYVWRQDPGHPEGQTVFVGRVKSNDLGTGSLQSQITAAGRYLAFSTASQLVSTDTDEVRDVYRYDVESGALTRVSTNILGVGGNGPFDAKISFPTEHHPTTAISDDGQKIVFITTEALSPADGNAEPDVYLWTPSRVSLISPGSVGSAAVGVGFAIDGAGQDIYFETAGSLTPADGDDLIDVYDARVGGGFSFAQAASCAGEACQASPSGAPSIPTPATARPPADGGNLKPKTCPKGKVAKGSRCVKKKHKKHKKHHGKKHKKHHGKKAGAGRGGGK